MKTTEDLLVALSEWMEAKAALQVCYADCETSPDYFCRRQAEREETARTLVGVALEEIIDQRVTAATGANT